MSSVRRREALRPLSCTVAWIHEILWVSFTWHEKEERLYFGMFERCEMGFAEDTHGADGEHLEGIASQRGRIGYITIRLAALDLEDKDQNAPTRSLVAVFPCFVSSYAASCE